MWFRRKERKSRFLADPVAILDARGIPTAVCPNCGDSWFRAAVMFDPETYDISAWGMDGECYSCGTLLTVCCPVDSMMEKEEPWWMP